MVGFTDLTVHSSGNGPLPDLSSLTYREAWGGWGGGCVSRGLSEHERWVRQQQREQERQERANASAARAAERERRQLHVEASKRRAEELNQHLDARVAEIQSILRRGIARSSRVDFRSLHRHDPAPSLELGTHGLRLPKPDWESFRPAEPGFLAGLLGGRRKYEALLAEQESAFALAKRERDLAEARREDWVRQQHEEHAQTVSAHQAELVKHNSEISEWQRNWTARDRTSVERYLVEVAKRISLPAGLPKVAEIAYSPRGEQVVARVELPARDIVPSVTRYSYVVSKDEQRATARPRTQIAELYRSAVSQIALLYIRDIFDADLAIQSVDVNCHVHTTNPATGHLEYPCLISVSVERSVFSGLNLREVTAEECLRHLNALVSRHPYEVEPVTPIREFDLTRFAFVDGLDAVSRLDSRPDLMEMTPTEFEHFVRQVFESMEDIQGWTTERTGDDGIDAVVINRNSVVGGLTVIQVKQYSRVLGPSHIRELVGAMDEKRAGRGVLVTTSWFTAGCWTKAKENGRIELIDGARLVALTQTHLGKEVLISGPPGTKRGDRPPELS